MVNPHQFRVSDLVKVVQVPPRLHDAAGIDTPELFQRVLGKTLRIEGFGRYGHLELNVLDEGSQAPNYCHHTIWIEPEFVKAADDATATMEPADAANREPSSRLDLRAYKRHF